MSGVSSSSSLVSYNPSSPIEIDDQLIALCSVSVNLDAVNYAERMTRINQHKQQMVKGLDQWTHLTTSEDPSSSDQLNCLIHRQLEMDLSNPNHHRPIRQIRFHPFQSHLIVVNSQNYGSISIYSSQTLDLVHQIRAPQTRSLLSDWGFVGVG